MIEFNKIFNTVGKTVKATVVAGLTVAKAHPFVAAVTVVVVVGGITYYYIKKKEKQKEADLKYTSGQHADKLENKEVFFYDPLSKSVTEVPPSNTSDGIRKRQVSKSSSLASSTNRNIDGGKVFPKNNLNNELSGDEKVIEYILNVSQRDSIESPPDSIECLDENINNLSVSSSRSESFENVTNADIGSVSSITSVLSGESDWCRACEVNPSNIRTLPCNHRYMCRDCAEKIIRIFRRCKICRSVIEDIWDI